MICNIYKIIAAINNRDLCNFRPTRIIEQLLEAENFDLEELKSSIIQTMEMMTKKE